MIIKVDGLMTKQRVLSCTNIGHFYSYTPTRVAKYEEKIRTEYLAANDKDSWFNGEPIEIGITAYSPVPKKHAALKHAYRPTGAAAHGFLAIVLDALRGTAYKRAGQIVKATVEKRYSDNSSYIIIEIKNADMGA